MSRHAPTIPVRIIITAANTVSRARLADSGPPDTINETIRFACDLDVETIQVSLAAAYPGTELYRQAIQNGWFRKDDLVRDDGTQAASIEYPGLLSAKEINDAVARMYSKFYFRPRPIGRMLVNMAKDSDERRRRLREGREFLGYLWGRQKAEVAMRETVEA